MIGLVDIDRLTGGRLGIHDVACPLCGPFRRAPVNQRRRTLRVWRIEPGFAGYHCARCGEKGAAVDRAAAPPDSAKLARARAEAAERDRRHRDDRLRKALLLWAMAVPVAGTTAEIYLRHRGYGGPLPATLRFLKARGEHPAAMIAAFGLAHEIEPGVIEIADHAVRGVHLTRLLPDGSDRERGDDAKIMIGHSTGWPIVLAPANDLLAVAVAEGIENALSAHEATGLGAWAAGSASRLPALADVIPSYIEAVTLLADDDPDGRRYADELARRIAVPGIEVRVTPPGIWHA